MHPRSHRVTNPEVIHILRSSPLVHHPDTKKKGYSGGWRFFFFQSILTPNYHKSCKLKKMYLQASPRKSSKFCSFIKFIMFHNRNGRDSAWTQLSSLPKTYSLPSITAAAPQCKLIEKPLESQLTHLIDVFLQSFYTNKLCKVYNVYLKKPASSHKDIYTYQPNSWPSTGWCQPPKYKKLPVLCGHSLHSVRGDGYHRCR